MSEPKALEPEQEAKLPGLEADQIIAIVNEAYDKRQAEEAARRRHADLEEQARHLEYEEHCRQAEAMKAAEGKVRQVQEWHDRRLAFVKTITYAVLLFFLGCGALWAMFSEYVAPFLAIPAIAVSYVLCGIQIGLCKRR